ncbi:cation/calcium exchanger 1-like [Lycium ferocissimum]|uniref:cation/calcium exchanger 1-like n=1 Tax=Lycium ferocissimum TaxID=112874 RepID=UPI002815E7A2|nr:cation/calcium exchanger 1-like [Lycium ferocissimum]
MAVFHILSKYRTKIPTLFFNITFLVIISCLTFHLYSSNSNFSLNNTFTKPKKDSFLLGKDIGCKGIEKFNSREEKCTYVKSHKGCKPDGYIFYLQLFYCTFSPILGYSLLALWLILLFYLLGDTASSYFCSSLEGLSKSLKLSPIIAGVTLLSLGNGAPDLFSSIVSFMNDGTNNIGLNSIIGGSFFVSSVVAGITSISISQHGRKIKKASFMRNVLFLILCVVCLLVVIIIGKIHLWGALAFFFLYPLYVCFIFVSEMYVREEKCLDTAETATDELLVLPIVYDMQKAQELSCELRVPLLMNKGEIQSEKQREIVCVLRKIGYVLELPLDLPRKLTIPNVSQENWSKTFAVVSITLAPLLLVLIWDFFGPESSTWAYGFGGVLGLACGLVVYFTSDGLHPPKKFNFLWLGLGFLMSITWTYILAEELISLLVSMGLILSISPSILGLTVLAWGNSLGDLVANVTLAKTGGPSGAQVALCGCYAGPIFNTLVGLGLSLIFTTWKAFPSSYIVPTDSTVYETIGFLLLGLLWALVILPKRDMKLDKFFGIGLLAVYSCFLFLKLSRAFGFIKFQVSP